MSRTRYDWDAIERDYRTGRSSLRELGARHGGVSEAAIRKRAKQHGWERDLSDRIRSEVRRKVSIRVDPKVEAAEKAKKEASDDELVDQASDAVADIIRDHQVILSRSRAQIDRLMGEVDSLLDRATSFGDDGNESDDKPGVMYISRVINQNTASLERIIKMERVAFGVEDDPGNNSGRALAELLRDVQPE